MTARQETLLWILQRASAAVLGIAVTVHLATVILAVRGGLSAAEILGRVRGNGTWLVFYGIFVAAVAMHAPIGLRAIFNEMTPLPARVVDVLAAAFAILLFAMGMRAALGLYGWGP